jgi:hypothetical protein
MDLPFSLARIRAPPRSRRARAAPRRQGDVEADLGHYRERVWPISRFVCLVARQCQHRAEHLACVIVVLNDEDAPARLRRRRCDWSFGLRAGRCHARQPDRERCTLTRAGARHLYRAPVFFDQRPRQRQPSSRPPRVRSSPWSPCTKASKTRSMSAAGIPPRRPPPARHREPGPPPAAPCVQANSTRPKLRTTDRLFWAGLARLWPGWRQALVIVSPDTVLRWQRRRFREYWARLSGRPTGGRPSVDVEIAALGQEDGCGESLVGRASHPGRAS